MLSIHFLVDTGKYAMLFIKYYSFLVIHNGIIRNYKYQPVYEFRFRRTLKYVSNCIILIILYSYLNYSIY